MKNCLRTFILAFCGMILLVCCDVVVEKSEIEYDERPDNSIIPLKTQFACDSDYTIENFLSYDAYRNVYATTRPEGVRQGPGFWKLWRCKDATYLAYYGYCYGDAWFFGFPSNMALIDSDTGDEYRIRHIEHYPLDTCFWINGAEDKFMRAILVFPPLQPSIKTIDILQPAMPSRNNFDGSAIRFANLSVEELRTANSSGFYRPKAGGETIY